MRRLRFGSTLLLTAFAAITLGGVAYGDRHEAQPAATGQTREFTLVAEPVRWEIQPGLVVDGWGYNGQIPGPTLRVTEGDLVRVTLVNHLPVPTTIHWHGLDVPPDMDGVPGLSQEAVEPGQSFVYQFVASNAGTRMYHSHTDTDAQMQLGLVGAFIVDPRTPEPEHFDRDFTYLLTEKALDFTPDVAEGKAKILHQDAGNGRGGALQYDLFLMNERAATAIDPITIAKGERIRVRLINLGNLVHAMHLHGHSFTIIATDGNPVPPAARLVKDTVTLGPGERVDLAIEGTNPGVWAFHCHINNHAANGMSTLLVYDGATPVVGGDAGHGSHGAPAALPVPATSATAIGTDMTHSQPSPTPAASTAAGAPITTASATPTPAPTASTQAPTGSSNVMVDLLDNRNAPARVTVPVGGTVTWMNNGTNLHTTSSIDGAWESGNLQAGGTFSFTFTTPGTYQYFCRQHFFQGMRGVVVVEPPQ